MSYSLDELSVITRFDPTGLFIRYQSMIDQRIVELLEQASQCQALQGSLLKQVGGMLNVCSSETERQILIKYYRISERIYNNATSVIRCESQPPSPRHCPATKDMLDALLRYFNEYLEFLNQSVIECAKQFSALMQSEQGREQFVFYLDQWSYQLINLHRMVQNMSVFWDEQSSHPFQALYDRCLATLQMAKMLDQSYQANKKDYHEQFLLCYQEISSSMGQMQDMVSEDVRMLNFIGAYRNCCQYAEALSLMQQCSADERMASLHSQVVALIDIVKTCASNRWLFVAPGEVDIDLLKRDGVIQVLSANPIEDKKLTPLSDILLRLKYTKDLQRQLEACVVQSPDALPRFCHGLLNWVGMQHQWAAEMLKRASRVYFSRYGELQQQIELSISRLRKTDWESAYDEQIQVAEQGLNNLQADVNALVACVTALKNAQSAFELIKDEDSDVTYWLEQYAGLKNKLAAAYKKAYRRLHKVHFSQIDAFNDFIGYQTGSSGVYGAQRRFEFLQEHVTDCREFSGIQFAAYYNKLYSYLYDFYTHEIFEEDDFLRLRREFTELADYFKAVSEKSHNDALDSKLNCYVRELGGELTELRKEIKTGSALSGLLVSLCRSQLKHSDISAFDIWINQLVVFQKQLQSSVFTIDISIAIAEKLGELETQVARMLKMLEARRQCISELSKYKIKPSAQAKRWAGYIESVSGGIDGILEGIESLHDQVIQQGKGGAVLFKIDRVKLNQDASDLRARVDHVSDYAEHPPSSDQLDGALQCFLTETYCPDVKQTLRESRQFLQRVLDATGGFAAYETEENSFKNS